MGFALTTLVSLCLAAAALAAPTGDITERTPSPSPLLRGPLVPRNVNGSIYQPSPLNPCLSSSQATGISSAYQWLLANPNSTSFVPTATALLDPNFQDYSDSINMLTGQQLGSATFSSRQAFITGSGAQPPLNVETLGVFYSCDAISWRWQSISGAGDDALPVKGITDFEISSAGQITTAYAEFNSWAFAKNLGLAP